jgi:protease I
VLVDGDLVLYESAAIVLHLVDTHRDAGLAPAIGIHARAHFYKWLIWLTNTLQAALMIYIYCELSARPSKSCAMPTAVPERRLNQVCSSAMPSAPMIAKRVLMPLPSYGFDPTEAAVPFCRLTRAGHSVVVATPSGEMAEADRRMLTGQDLPRLIRGSLMATPDAVERYQQMASSGPFRQPMRYQDIDGTAFDALLLPGGHDKGMRPYLEDARLQSCVADFFVARKPVAAICHGTLLVGRSQHDGRSVLFGRKTTGLTRRQELVAWRLTRQTLGDYYRTYDVPMADELISVLQSRDDYDPGPGFPIPLRRDSEALLSAGFTVRDDCYLSARWPGDAHRFAEEFCTLLAEHTATA